MEVNIGSFVDASIQEFRVFCDNQDVGSLSGFRNVMITAYEQVRKVKDALVTKMCANQIAESDRVKADETLIGLYDKLLRIEERVLTLDQIIKDRRKTDKNTVLDSD